MAYLDGRCCYAAADEGGSPPAGQPKASAPKEGVLGVFQDRSQLEKALNGLEESGINRMHINLLTNADAAKNLGAAAKGADAEHPMDRSEQGNIQGLLTGIPLTLGAMLAAGVTVASGGTFAGVALAAVGGAAGAGAVGAGVARLFKGNIDERYDSELASGGMVVMVSVDNEDENKRAADVLRQYGAKDVSTHALNEAGEAPRSSLA